MCLILLAYQKDPQYPLVLCANRDELYDRPTANARFWLEYPGVLAGKDLTHGGTWLGITRAGRWAALSNYRESSETQTGTMSRGALVRNFLIGTESPERYAEMAQRQAHQFNGFNLLVGDATQVVYISNCMEGYQVLTPGLYGLSNHLLDTPWHKVTRGKQALDSVLKANSIKITALLSILADQTPADVDHDLLDTGLTPELEQLLSSIFIKSDNYGTRSSTVIQIDADEEVTFVERTFLHMDGSYQDRRYHFGIV